MANSDSEGAASGGELSAEEFRALDFLAVVGGLIYSKHPTAIALQRLLNKYDERGERIAELEFALEREQRELRDWAVSADQRLQRVHALEQEVAALVRLMRLAGDCIDYYVEGGSPHQGAKALLVEMSAAIAAHDTKQGQGGESGSEVDGHS